MKSSKMIPTIETHTFGEPTRIINGGLFNLKGSTMAEKRDYMAAHYDWLVRAVMQEPRGHRDMFGAVLVPPISNEADFGVIFTDNNGFMNMCGHATIGVTTAIVETGMVEVKEPETHIVLESPAGLVYATAHVEDYRAKSVSFKNVPAFLEHKDVEVDVKGVGKIKADIAYGGNYFAQVPAEAVGVEVHPSNGSILKDLGMKIKKALNESVVVQHPTKPFINFVEAVTFYGKPITVPEANYKNVHIFSNGQADRSPGGTGTTAMVARYFARGEIGLGEQIIAEGFVGGKFIGKPVEEVQLGKVKAVYVEITGSAFIMGFQNILIDPHDPNRGGFVVD